MPPKAKAVLGSLVFLVVAPGVIAGWVPGWLAGWTLGAPLLGIESGRLLGALLVVLGLAVLLESFARFALEGLGTPAPVYPTRRLVVGGLYRHVRNPIYLAVLAMVLGQALVFGEARLLAYAAAVWLCCHLFVVAYEEPTLRESFGAEYEAFVQNVPRWIPRLRPWRGMAD